MSTWQDPDDNELRYFHEFVDVANLRVLEIGCGEGRLIWRYADSAARVIGIDPDFDRVEDALRECPPALRQKVGIVNAYSEALPFPREQFDRAILAWSL
jgi:ubiquinone/menaquinone biosynthesis C-methylase UbiE